MSSLNSFSGPLRADLCSNLSAYGGGCPGASIGNGSVDIGGSGSRPGTGNSGGGVWDAAAAEAAAEAERVRAAECANPLVVCRDTYNVTPPLAGRGPITWADIASFTPTRADHGMQPSGWMVIGLETNFYITAGQHVQQGEVLGIPASVRFTPQRFRWDYGDGHHGSSSTGGARWADAGLPEFSATGTSHVYETAGAHEIAATIDYRADYRFGGTGDWIPIAGTLPIPVERLIGTATTATTMLVERDCTAARTGPGC